MGILKRTKGGNVWSKIHRQMQLGILCLFLALNEALEYCRILNIGFFLIEKT